MTMRMLRLCGLGLALLLAGPTWAATCHLKDYGTLPIDMQGGRATTMVKINGTDTRFIIDTGAFFNIMSKANATSLGLRMRALPVDFRISGIGGTASAQYTRVKQFGILGTTLKDIDFFVGGSDAGAGLLGANLLDFADLELDLAHGKLTLFETEHCEQSSLAYWAKDDRYSTVDIEPSDGNNDPRTFVNVIINGKKVRALIDTGADATLLTRAAAEHIGIDLSAPGVKPGRGASGFGAKTVKSWIVPVDSFSVGTENIQHSQMLVIDGNLGDRSEMLLGLDFVLAHHMFISNNKKKIYFTYNGGRVFALAPAADDDNGANGGWATGDNGDAPKTAADYALRGQARLSRGEPAAAMTDLDEAIRMAPDQAGYYVARARAYMAQRQPEGAVIDLDKSLSIDPKNLDALVLRAELRLSRKNREGAAADVAAATALAPAGAAQARALASMDIQLDQPAAAIPMLDDWIRLHGNDAMLGVALNARCWASGLSNQALDEGLKACRKAIRRDGEKAMYLDSLGLLQLRLGHYPESIEAYQQAVTANPRSAWSRYGLGLAKIRSGQAQAGHADLTAALALDPKIEARAAQYGLTAAGP